MANNISYTSFSKIYDIFDVIFLLGRKGNPRLGLLDIIPNTPLRVLDVCVGTAASALVVAGRNDKNHIQGIDVSEAMLSAARRKIAQSNHTNLEVINMSATEMDYADASFDVVMVSFALHEFEPGLRDKVFQEVGRVLKPGGIFCVIDFARQDSLLNQMFLKLWALVEPSSFAHFLDLDWRTYLTPYGLRFEGEHEYSFSKLYLWRKA